MTGGWSRRDAIVSGVCATAVAGGLGAVLVHRSRGDAPEFRAMTRPVGYRWLVQAGGGVVDDSDPEAECQATVSKSRALMRAAEEAGRFAGRGNR